jgi:hypothetical protein
LRFAANRVNDALHREILRTDALRFVVAVHDFDERVACNGQRPKARSDLAHSCTKCAGQRSACLALTSA